MVGGRRISEVKVCHTCGHAGFSAFIATCFLCKVSCQHTYCMRTVCFEVPLEWHCEECLQSTEAVGNDQAPDKQEETIKDIGSTSAKQEMLQYSHRGTSRKIDAGKVKFMSSEEVITLASGKRPKGSQCLAGLNGNFADLKSPLIPMKAVTHALPSSKVLRPPFSQKKVPACTRFDVSSSITTTKTKHINMEKGMETVPQVCKVKPAKFKASALENNFSTCTRPSNVRCDYLDLPHVEDQQIRMAENKATLEPQDDCLFIEKEPAYTSLAFKEEKILPKEIEVTALPVNDSGTAVRSISQFKQISSQEMFLPLKLVVSSDEKSHYALEACWSGAIEVLDSVPQFQGIVHAHLSCQVSPKVYDISKQFPGTLQFKLLHRENVWPKIFKLYHPTKDDVALYFKCSSKRHIEKYDNFVKYIDSHDYALQGCIANVELLLFTSAQLRVDSHKFGGSIYLWSVFRHLRQKNASNGGENVSCITSTLVHHMQKSEVPLVASSLEVDTKCNIVRDYPAEADMEIDMVGGSPVGRVDIPINIENAPSGFSKTIQNLPVNFYSEKANNSDLLDSPPGFPFPRYKRHDPVPKGKTTR